MLADFAEADDVAQETFVRLWRAGLAGEESRRVLAWIYRTGTRLAIDRLRERSRMAAAGEETTALARLASLAPDGEDALSARQTLAALASRLPADELEVALLSRIDGLTQAEIAEVSGVSERTVRRSLRRLEERIAAVRKGIRA